MRGLLSSVVLMVALGLTGCYDDDEDYSAQSENCAVVDYGLGETYTLCCRLSCTAEYDDGDYTEQCREENSCTAASGAPCPLFVLQDNRFPACL